MSEPTRTHLPDAADATRTSAPQTGSGAADAMLAPPGYELLEEIGSGGMGAVYRARDLELGREVAIKILLTQYAPDSPTARRFLDEARITGRLQHPGIPAIYRVGSLPDGRPFLAMKLIAGRTLDDMLKQRAAPTMEGGTFLSPLERAAEGMFDRLDAVLQRGRLLGVFEHVAQAVAYAHQQGVIHRDLKPANVMVGAFGEVQVMDWGIARSGDRRAEPTGSANGEPAATVEYSPLPSYKTPQSDLTQAGAILGTPAYMPPEQAIGAVDQIGKPSDVFGLGAILCVILTGKPPYAGADAESNRQLAARAKLDDAFSRLDASGAEPELVALAKRCLAAEPAQRPADAGEVAEAVAVLRADSERRARQAEMDRARAEVKTAEERKRRRIQWALALSVIGLLAVVGYTARRIDNEQSRLRAEQEAKDRRADEERKEREAEQKTRQVAHERDVSAALNEVQLLREDGWKQSDDPARWLITLDSAASALKRAEKVLWEGEPSIALLNTFAAAEKGLEQDNRDRALLAELDRISDSNEIRYFFPFPLTLNISNRFAAAFRAHGIDLATVPTSEAAAWLKGHRLRSRLITGIRNWHQSLPSMGLAAVIDTSLVGALATSAAVAGPLGPVAIAHDPNKGIEKLLRRRGLYAQLEAVLNAVTEDTFAKEWWRAIEHKNGKRLAELIADPRLRQMPPREMASLAEGLNPYTGTDEKAVDDFLALALERFPGEFWVHFRLAVRSHFGGGSVKGTTRQELEEKRELFERTRREKSLRHLTAALAIRPNSAIARMVMGMEYLEHGRNASEGMRMLQSAIEVDPTSPWPHLFMGIHAMEQHDWPRAFQSLKECIRLDPDTGFFITSSMSMLLTSERGKPGKLPTDREFIALFSEMIDLHPEHPGGYDLLASYYRQLGDHRLALANLRKAKERQTASYMGRPITEAQISELEGQASWESKLPAVLRGEIHPANRHEVFQLASYCATFEKRFALATRFIAEGIEADSKLLDNWVEVAHFAGWAIQASIGQGSDGAGVPLAIRERYRRYALAWIRETIHRAEGGTGAGVGFYLATVRDLDPVRDKEQLALLPADERGEWETLWANTSPIIKNRGFDSQSKPVQLAPAPRAKLQ